MWDQVKENIKQPKQMCGTCKNAGRIVGYIGRGKSRKMQLWCEIHKDSVLQDYLCGAYKNERGISLYEKGE